MRVLGPVAAWTYLRIGLSSLGGAGYTSRFDYVRVSAIAAGTDR